MLLQQEKLQHLNSIAHEGKVVVFATDADGQIHYTIKQDGFEDSYLNTPGDQRTGWEQWKQLEFPNEDKDDISVVELETEEFTRQDNGDFLVRSRYRTFDQSAVAPVQLVSGVGHIYVFRQSKENTLLCDRFVLDGMTNELTRKLEVRFKRSRQKHKPTEDMKMGASGLQNVDSLDYRDTDNEFFYEPTTELKCINNLHDGWFSVVQVPTNEHDKHRWHIFAYNSATKKVQLTTLRSSDEGLFDIKDYTVLEPKSAKDATLVPRSIPGIIQRTLDLQGVAVTNGLAATKYDIQQEQETKAGPQLMRTSSKVMLVVPTDKGTAALSFAISGDGILSQIDETPQNDVLRSTQRDVLLPLNTLEQIKAFGDTSPPEIGSITGFSVGTEADGAEDLVKITSPEAVNLVSGDMVEIQKTHDYNGLYSATKIDEDTFTIELPENNEMGTWEAVDEVGGLIFDGMVIGYQKTADGKLQVTASNHGLEDGDRVLLTGTQNYNNTYPIQKIDDANFVIQKQWSLSEAVNVKLESLKRRGLVFDGVKDYIELPPESFPEGDEVTVSFWAKGASSLPNSTAIFTAINEETLATDKWQLSISLPWWDEKIYFNCFQNYLGSIECPPENYKDQWNHWAFTRKVSNAQVHLAMYLNGKLFKSFSTATIHPLKEVTEMAIGRQRTLDRTYWYPGTIADFQIWDIARSEKEIKDSMYLQLTGKETGLVGYWRLGAISEGAERKVVDFSVNGNHGIVHGDPYVGGVILNRNLGDGLPAVKYSNDDLVAVSQRATYIEEFEFKVNPTVDINNADGNGKKIFQQSYWGKTSRSAEEKITISSQPDDFEDLGNGWYRATCRFTIPDGVAMIQTFEIADIRGTWESLEIRKHHIRLVSDAITEAKYHDSISLPTLADSSAKLKDELKTLKQKEWEKSKLLKERSELEELIALLQDEAKLDAAIAVKQAEVNSQKGKISNLNQAIASAYENYQNERNNPLNYWCKLVCRAKESWIIRIYTSKKQLLYANIGANGNPYYTNNKFKFEPVDGGYYRLVSAYENKVPASNSTNSGLYAHSSSSSNSSAQWKLRKQSNGYYIIENRATGQVWDWGTDGYNVYVWSEHGGTNQQWKIVKVGGETNNNIGQARQIWEGKKNDLDEANKRLAQLEGELEELKSQKSNVSGNKTELEQRLQAVMKEIQKVLNELNVANTKFIDGVKQNQGTAAAMSQLAQDSRNFTSQGALLGFVNPASRLNSLETCEGNVQLSYFDEQGRMRRSLYDATSDSLNTTFEQWIPDNLRTCLNFNNSSSSVKLKNPIDLTGSSTIEAWFAYPFTEKLYWHVLASSQDDKQQIVVSQGRYLGLRINGLFFYSGYDLEKLSFGWYHLTITSKETEDTSNFYLNGEKVGTAPVKPIVEFDSNSDFISLPKMNVNYSQGFTLEAWVYYESLHGSEIIKFSSSSSSSYNIILGNKNNDTLFVTIGSKTIEALGVMESQQWMHLAATVDPLENVTLYKNGQPVATGKISALSTKERNNNFIGKINKGKIAEVRHWNIPRSQKEIQENLGTNLAGDEFGLVGYWQFTDDGAKDSSSGKIDGTVNGTQNFANLSAKITSNIASLGNITNNGLKLVSKTSDLVNSGVKLRGNTYKIGKNTDYIEVDNYQGFKGKQPHTIEAWIKGNSSPSGSIVSLKTSSLEWMFRVYGDKLALQKGDGTYIYAHCNAKLNDGQWHHVAYTLEPRSPYLMKVDDAKFYVDGQLETIDFLRTTHSLGDITTEKLSIGNDSEYSSFDGEMAEVRIWDKVRTQAEIQADMYKALTGSEPNLVGYWPLRNGSAKDRSTHAYKGTIKGSLQTVPFDKVQMLEGFLFDDESSPETNASSATIGQTALKFDGSGDYVEIQNYKGVTGTNPRTVEAWIKTTSTNQAIVSWGANSASQKWTFRVHDHDKLRVEVNGGYIIGSTPLSDGKWHHVACTWQNDGSPNVTDVKLYVDGKLETISDPLPRSINTGTSRNVFIGNDFFNRYFKGDIAEVRIWNKARTQVEIKADMAKALTGSEPGLVGYWPLRDGSAQDYSTNGNNGSLKGNVQTVPFDKVQLPMTANHTATPIKETDPNARHFGKLAEVRIWDTVLKDEEIAANSKTLLSGNEPGLLAYYPMNESTDTEVRDRSGNNLHGTMQGASWWGCAAPIGNVGHTVMQFDGQNDYLELGEFNPGKTFTVECWVKPEKIGQKQAFIGKHTGSGDNIFLVGYYGETTCVAFNSTTAFGFTEQTAGDWFHLAVVVKESQGKSEISIYKDGVHRHSYTYDTTFGTGEGKPWTLGQEWDGSRKSDFFQGQMAEVRIWNKARSREEIRATMQQHLTGQEEGLVGYWPLTQIDLKGENLKTTPDLTGNHPGTVYEAILAKDNTLPIGANALVSSEYNTITVDPSTGRKSAMMRRFFASPGLNGAEFIPEKRIEELQLQWIGNAQFAPTLLGYIEGAPPIPTENLTVQPDYNGATSVELNMSEDVEFNWSRAQDAGLGASAEFFLGYETDAYAGIGAMAKVAEMRAGFKGSLDFSYQFLNESNITSSSSNSMTDRLELRGTPEQSVKFPHLGKRFIPKNVGYALVISGLADVFITKLARSGKMVGYQVRPVDGIPPDVNTITFLINPAYTMNGSLDGMTGSSATSDRFFKHVPEMRSQYGSLYPASYYRLQEAYNLKQAIEREDKRRESYFQQFNARLLDTASLSRETEGGAAKGSISLEREVDKANTNLTEEEKQAKEKAKIEKFEQDADEKQKEQSAAAKKKQAEIESQISDQEQRAHATDSFAGWQKKMENILIRAGKRNIVNTYVWDGDGGMRTESQSFASTAEHTIGGSFTLGAGLGFDGYLGTVKSGKYELTALATVNLTQTMSKTESRSKGIELNVDLSGVEHVGITDYKDYPVMPGEKVDRYRFMSFYLEGSTNNFYDFFHYVVDPEWLRSNDEEARALRQAMGKANKTWRVLHRVTYVERPALMGFGRDLRSLQGVDNAADAIVTEFQQLAQKQLQIEDKLDMILNYLAEKESQG